ncbi:MAG TPA: YIP1 family protein [Pyrinomonadaceae bacterium]|nr:YIP1 family protein [Pyrinomonadaceae bacterium]
MSDSLEQQPFIPPPPPSPPQPPEPVVGPRPTRLRPFAIGLFALGLIMVPVAALKIVNVEVFSGAALCFFGMLLFGLSFVRLPVISNPEGPIPALQKVFGIFYEPTRVFRNLRAHPHWVVAFVIIAGLNVIYSNAFIRRVTPERITNHVVEKMSEMGPPFAPPAEMLESIRNKQLDQLKSPTQRVGAAFNTITGTFVWGALVSAITLLLILAFGGKINYWQAIAVYFYTILPVAMVQKLLSLVILYIKEPDDIHPILGQESLVQDNLGILFLPAAHPVLFAISSFIGVLSLYGLWLRGKGLREGGTRVSSTAGYGVAITLWVVGLLLVTIFTALFPGFIG